VQPDAHTKAAWDDAVVDTPGSHQAVLVRNHCASSRCISFQPVNAPAFFAKVAAWADELVNVLEGQHHLPLAICTILSACF
jgi:hypothetical protein